MREIKFRAWDGEKMRCDIYSGDCLNTFFETATIPMMQFTGLKDINGIEIYEGDIVTCKSYAGSLIVSYKNFDNANIASYVLCDHKGEVVFSDFDRVIVIGNIHERSDLLKL